jgi:hypothetical protein
MKALLVDFCRRWWWALAFAFVFAAVSPFSGTPIMLAPIGALLLMFDAQRGAIRPLRLLPLTLRELSKATWVQAVLLVPMVSLILMLPGGLYRSLATADGDLIWFRIILQAYVGLGYAGFMLLPAVFMTQRPAERWYEHIVQGLLGACWGLSFAGLGFVLSNLPKSPAAIQQWHWAIFAVAPFTVIFSYLFSEELIRRRAGPRRSKTTANDSPRNARQGAQGYSAFLLNIPVRAAGMTLFIFLSQQLFFTLLFSDSKTPPGQVATMQCALFGIMFAAFMTENAGLRALRVLPMRSSQLALLLCTPAFAAAIAVALITSWQGSLPGGRTDQFAPVEMGVVVAGVGLLRVAIALYYPRAGKLILILLAATIMPAMMIFPPRFGWAVAIGLIAGCAGYWLLLTGIRRAPSFYENRRMFGMTGDQQQC